MKMYNEKERKTDREREDGEVLWRGRVVRKVLHRNERTHRSSTQYALKKDAFMLPVEAEADGLHKVGSSGEVVGLFGLPATEHLHYDDHHWNLLYSVMSLRPVNHIAIPHD